MIDRLTGGYPALSPQLKRAAKFVLDAPAEVAINSMRTVAGDASVAPSTMLRLAKSVGFPSYEAFRKPFRDAMRRRGAGFRDRARWLQTIADDSSGGPLFGQMVTANLANVEHAFANTTPAELERIADLLATARKVHIIALRGAFSLAHYLFYVGSMALPTMQLAPGLATSLVDDLADVDGRDAVIAFGFDPYTRDTVKAARFATRRGARLIAVTDSRVSPLAVNATHLIIAPTASPQFFPSHVATTALLETLIAFIVARGDTRTIDSIAEYDRLRDEFGVYWREDDEVDAGPRPVAGRKRNI